MNDPKRTLLQLTEQLLESVSKRDWHTYASLCDEQMTCFEPEAKGHLVEGMPFHRFYFQLGGGSTATNQTLCQPKVHLLGDVGVVAYTRLQQRLDADGHPRTWAWNESRVWQRQGEQWKLIHFHRSPVSMS